MLEFSNIVLLPGMVLAHCTPLHHQPGVSWTHVIAWSVLVGIAGAICVLGLIAVVRRLGWGGDHVPRG